MTRTDRARRARRILSAAGFALALLMFATAFFVFLSTMIAKRENRTPTFFGYSFSIVVTGSMEPEIRVGELLIVKPVDMDEIEVGQDIVFVSLSGEIAGERVVHRVVEKGTDDVGLYFRTEGINNHGITDADKVHAANFVGAAAGHSMCWGKILGFFSHTETMLWLLLLLIVVPFAVKQVVKIVRAAKEAQTEETKTDKENDAGTSDGGSPEATTEQSETTTDREETP